MKTIKGCLAGVGVPAKTEEKQEPMTFAELRKRLKHIAGLCYGLSVDLANEIENRERLENECIQLRAENGNLFNEVKALNDKFQRIEYNKKYNKKRSVKKNV